MMTPCVVRSCASTRCGQQSVQHPKYRSPAHWPRRGPDRADTSHQYSTRLLAPKASAQTDNNGAAEGLGKVSPDVLKLFGETQRNLLELNRSRLNALDELRVARTRISELETELQQTSTQVDNSGAMGQGATQTTEAAQSEDYVYTQPQPTSTAAAPAVITVSYITGWSRVMMHYSADGQAWSGLPGVRMEDGQNEYASSKVLQVRGNRLEFVLTNGDGQWDTPDPYGTNQANRNYVIDAPGSYVLQSGRLSKVS